MNLRGPSWSEQLWFGRALRCDPLMVDALAGAVSLVCCCVPVSWLALLETVTWFCCCCCCCCCSCLGAVASTCASTVANVVAPSNSVQLCSTPTVVFRMLADPSFSTLLLRYCGSFLLTSVVFACPWRLCCREKGEAKAALFSLPVGFLESCRCQIQILDGVPLLWSSVFKNFIYRYVEAVRRYT